MRRKLAFFAAWVFFAAPPVPVRSEAPGSCGDTVTPWEWEGYTREYIETSRRN